MAFHTVIMDAPDYVAIGAGIGARNLRDKAIIISGTFTATVVVEASFDGTTFVRVGQTTDLAAIIQVPFACRSLRINTTAYTAGAINANLVADNPRTS
jgi:hypothetical protein